MLEMMDIVLDALHVHFYFIMSDEQIALSTVNRLALDMFVSSEDNRAVILFCFTMVASALAWFSVL